MFYFTLLIKVPSAHIQKCYAVKFMIWNNSLYSIWWYVKICKLRYMRIIGITNMKYFRYPDGRIMTTHIVWQVWIETRLCNRELLDTGIKVYNDISALHIQTNARQPCTSQDKHRFDVSNSNLCCLLVWLNIIHERRYIKFKTSWELKILKKLKRIYYNEFID